ncbi:MAG: aldehyde dehydrogenase [Pseudonocardia sp. SCN 72-86]|nr:MAG: aldehyde dehydrogenase [Pseudonocardia sp. SCN 72-86]
MSTLTEMAAEVALGRSAPHFPMYIGGQWVDSQERYEIVDPSTEQVVATSARGDRSHAEAAVRAARQSFESGVWRNTSVADRAALLERFAAAWEARHDEMAALTTRECGVPIRMGAVFGVISPMGDTRQFVELLRQYQWERPGPAIAPALGAGILRREPVGVCLGIVPWNTPLALAIWKTIPALAAGNSVVLKVDEKTPLTALALADALSSAGLPDGVFNVVTGDGADVGSYLTAHPDVAHVSFTGSTETGRQVMTTASGGLKSVVLELGGKGPNIVLDDADLPVAVDGAIWAFMMHSGQACESGTRLLLPDSIHDEFVDRLVARISTMKIGPTMDPATDVGPLISAAQRRRVLDYIESGKQEGARVVVGGGVPQGAEFDTGHWVEPTVFVDATNDMRIAREEIFGPVLTVLRYESDDDAVKIANDTPYGLSAGVWSQDLPRAIDVARRIEAGSVWINDFHCVNPQYPFGGYKQSGVGRELGGSALDDYTEEKAITFHLGGRAASIAKFGLVLGTEPDTE